LYVAIHSAWLEFAVQVAIGTIAGGFSDTVAVWMLFRPRRRVLWFQGAIPKNQPRLAKSIGRTVGERLLTPHDLLQEIARSGLSDALERQIALLLSDALEREHGPLTDIIPAELLPTVEGAIQDFLTRFVNDLPFRERMVARLVLTDRTVEKIIEAMERPIGRPGRWLPPDTAQRLAHALSPAVWTWIEQQIPALVERFRVQEMVERKVLAFSQDRIEELIRGVIDRELRLIIRTGYVLGGLIAVVLFGITHLVGMWTGS
jgi:uncharacterized membrane protein YheB (UPF0754 family)